MSQQLLLEGAKSHAPLIEGSENISSLFERFADLAEKETLTEDDVKLLKYLVDGITCEYDEASLDQALASEAPVALVGLYNLVMEGLQAGNIDDDTGLHLKRNFVRIIDDLVLVKVGKERPAQRAHASFLIPYVLKWLSK